MAVSHEPLSLLPAPGWRVAYIFEADDDEDSECNWCEEPLVAWAVCRLCDRYDEDGNHNEVHGYVCYESYIDCVQEHENFWQYLAPGAPSPTPAEVAREQEVRVRLSRFKRSGRLDP